MLRRYRQPVSGQTLADELGIDPGPQLQAVHLEVLRGEIDLAVHSLKDLPTGLVPGLQLAAVLQREDPRDALVSASGAPLAQEDKAREQRGRCRNPGDKRFQQRREISVLIGPARNGVERNA